MRPQKFSGCIDGGIRRCCRPFVIPAGRAVTAPRAAAFGGPDCKKAQMQRIALLLATLLLLPVAAAAQQNTAAMIAEAEAAAPPSISDDATYVDWEGNVLKQGTNGWTCMPSPPGTTDMPMCLDEAWVQWAQAWQSKDPVSIDEVGVAYMLEGDAGTSNIDPFAEGPTEDNEWVVTGPHLMIIVPDAADLDGLPTDPETGGPWVMWKGTPYAHIMVPIGEESTLN